MEIDIQWGNAINFKADVLAVKYHQRLRGLCKRVLYELRGGNINLRESLPKRNKHFLAFSHGELGSPFVLFLGTDPRDEYEYRTIRSFSLNVLKTLKSLDIQSKHIVITPQGYTGFLDEKACCTCLPGIV